MAGRKRCVQKNGSLSAQARKSAQSTSLAWFKSSCRSKSAVKADPERPTRRFWCLSKRYLRRVGWHLFSSAVSGCPSAIASYMQFC